MTSLEDLQDGLLASLQLTALDVLLLVLFLVATVLSIKPAKRMATKKGRSATDGHGSRRHWAPCRWYFSRCCLANGGRRRSGNSPTCAGAWCISDPSSKRPMQATSLMVGVGETVPDPGQVGSALIYRVAPLLGAPELASDRLPEGARPPLLRFRG